MTTLKTGLFAALGVVAVLGTAVAQAPDPNADPNAPAEAEPEASVPPPAQPPTVVVQPTYEPGYQPQPAEPVAEEEADMFTRLGFSISAGGGVDGFTNETMRDTTSTGGGWDVTAGIGTKSYIGFEGSYIGSAQSIDAIGLDNDAVLVGNGLQGAVRLNFTTTYAVQPFVFGGAAWRHYSLANESFNTSAIENSSDAFEIPVGAGIAYKYEGLLLDLRGDYRWSTGADMVPSLTQPGEAANMSRWGVGADIGYEF